MNRGWADLLLCILGISYHIMLYPITQSHCIFHYLNSIVSSPKRTWSDGVHHQHHKHREGQNDWQVGGVDQQAQMLSKPALEKQRNINITAPSQPTHYTSQGVTCVHLTIESHLSVYRATRMKTFATGRKNKRTLYVASCGVGVTVLGRVSQIR